MKEISNNSTNEELIEFAKEQCFIFPEDSDMGKYLRETIKILENKTFTESSEDVMWNSIALLNELRTKYYFDEKEEHYKALSLAIESIRKQILDKVDMKFFIDPKNELLDKVKQAREEIQKLVDMCGSDTVAEVNMKSGLGLALEKIDKLIESEED